MRTGEFRICYVRALILAALAFGLTHGVQFFVISFYHNGFTRIDPTGFITLIIYGLILSSAFLSTGWIFSYFPSRVIAKLLEDKYCGGLFYVFSGVIAGILFLPLCAAVPFILFPEPDNPSYLARYAEFGFPMTIAGALGGYVFWRGARGTAV